MTEDHAGYGVREKVLFIGGSADGRRISVPKGMSSFNVSVDPVDLAQNYKGPFLTTEPVFTAERYLLVPLCGGYVIYVIDGMSIKGATKLLLQNYTGGL